jgi:hypothetical protein
MLISILPVPADWLLATTLNSHTHHHHQGHQPLCVGDSSARRKSAFRRAFRIQPARPTLKGAPRALLGENGDVPQLRRRVEMNLPNGRLHLHGGLQMVMRQLPSAAACSAPRGHCLRNRAASSCVVLVHQ